MKLIYNLTNVFKVPSSTATAVALVGEKVGEPLSPRISPRPKILQPFGGAGLKNAFFLFSMRKLKNDKSPPLPPSL